MPKVSEFPLATYALTRKVPLVGEEHLLVKHFLPPSIVAPTQAAASISDTEGEICTLFTVPYTGRWILNFSGQIINYGATITAPNALTFLGMRANGAGASLAAQIFILSEVFSALFCSVYPLSLTARADLNAGDVITIFGYKADVTGSMKLGFIQATGIMAHPTA